MSRCTSGTAQSGAAGRKTGAPGAAEVLALAASPTFALMALATQVLGEGPMGLLCGTGEGFALAGMVPMYLLMSAFHSAPWLKLIARQRLRAVRPAGVP